MCLTRGTAVFDTTSLTRTRGRPSHTQEMRAPPWGRSKRRGSSACVSPDTQAEPSSSGASSADRARRCPVPARAGPAPQFRASATRRHQRRVRGREGRGGACPGRPRRCSSRFARRAPTVPAHVRQQRRFLTGRQRRVRRHRPAGTAVSRCRYWRTAAWSAGTPRACAAPSCSAGSGERGKARGTAHARPVGRGTGFGRAGWRCGEPRR